MSANAPQARRLSTAHLAGGLVAIAVATLLVISAGSSLQPTTTVAVRPAVFERASVAAVAADDTTTPGVTVQAPGWLEADPFFVAATALADGVVETVDVLEGETVEAGQVVATLVADDAAIELERAAAAHAVMVAAEAVARADLDAAEADWANPVARERAVAVAEAAVAELEAELVRLPAQVSAASATLDGLREELERLETALERSAANPIEVIVLRAGVAAQESKLESTRRMEAVLQARLNAAAAELAAARRDFELRTEERRALAAARAARDRAAAAAAEAAANLSEAQLRFDRMVIRAPITGVVQRRFKVPGDKVMFGMDSPHSAHVLHLYDPESIQVRVDVPLADAAHVFVGQVCEVVVEVLPDTTFGGTVTRVTHEADLQKNTLQVKVAVTDPSPLLRPEMLTRVRFVPRGGVAAPSSDDASTVRVPVECIDPDGPRVVAVRDRRGGVGKAVFVPIEIDHEIDGYAHVRGALNGGDLLVVAPDALESGERLRAVAGGAG